MHKMRIWFVKMKGANVLEITLKTPLQKISRIKNEDLVKWLGSSFIMLTRKYNFKNHFCSMGTIVRGDEMITF